MSFFSSFTLSVLPCGARAVWQGVYPYVMLGDSRGLATHFTEKEHSRGDYLTSCQEADDS